MITHRELEYILPFTESYPAERGRSFFSDAAIESAAGAARRIAIDRGAVNLG